MRTIQYFALHYQTMFNDVNHWYFNLTTYLFFPCPIIELLGLVLLVKTARKEFLPEFLIWAGGFADASLPRATLDPVAGMHRYKVIDLSLSPT